MTWLIFEGVYCRSAVPVRCPALWCGVQAPTPRTFPVFGKKCLEVGSVQSQSRSHFPPPPFLSSFLPSRLGPFLSSVLDSAVTRSSSTSWPAVCFSTSPVSADRASQSQSHHFSLTLLPTRGEGASPSHRFLLPASRNSPRGTSGPPRCLTRRRCIPLLLAADETAFRCLGRVHPVTHALGNAFKRIFVVVISTVVFDSKFKHLPVYVATAGVVMYALARKL